MEATTAPLELNYNELREVGLESSELVVYGHVPMMGVSTMCDKDGSRMSKRKRNTCDEGPIPKRVFCEKQL